MLNVFHHYLGVQITPHKQELSPSLYCKSFISIFPSHRRVWIRLCSTNFEGYGCVLHVNSITKTSLPYRYMAPSSLEELLYRRLMSSPAFHAWVRRVYARINRIPIEQQPIEMGGSISKKDYTPTRWHKINAARIIFWDELKKSFTFRS